MAAAAQPLSRPDRAAPAITALCAAGLFVVLTAISLTTIERLKYVVLADRAAASPGRLIGALHIGDFLLFGVAAALGVCLLVQALRWRGVSLLLA